MTQARVKLPTDRTDLGRAVRYHVQNQRERMSSWRATTLLATLYCQGYRSFERFNPDTGEVKGAFLDDDDEYGNPAYADQRILFEVQEIAGLLSGLNMNPVVKRRGDSLTHIRERAVSQIQMDAAVDPQHLEKVASQGDFLLASIGSHGIQTRLAEQPSEMVKGIYDIVHPAEITPFPSVNLNPYNTEGMTRTRFMPEAFMREVYGSRIVNNVMRAPGAVTTIVPLGTAVDIMAYDEYSDPHTDAGGWGGGGGTDPAGPLTVRYFEVSETYLYGDGDTLARYIVTCGDFVIEDISFTQEVTCPLQFVRMYDNMTFYGMGHFQMRFATHRVAERLRQKFFSDTMQASLYPMLVLPQGVINENQALGNIGDQLKYVKAGFDPLAGDRLTPIKLDPVPVNQFAAQGAAIFDSHGLSMSPARDILADKGRADSASAIRALEDAATRPLTKVVQSKVRAYSMAHRNVAEQVSQAVLQSQDAVEVTRPIPITKLSIDLLGAVIDDETNTLSFVDNPVPNVGNLEFTVKDTSAVNQSTRLGQVLEAFQLHQDFDRLILTVIEEGLDLPMYMREEQGAIDTITHALLKIYNDGITPQPVVLHEGSLMPDIQMRVTSAVLKTPAYRKATEPVRRSIGTLHADLMEAVSGIAPGDVPPLDQVLGLGAQDVPVV